MELEPKQPLVSEARTDTGEPVSAQVLQSRSLPPMGHLLSAYTFTAGHGYHSLALRSVLKYSTEAR